MESNALQDFRPSAFAQDTPVFDEVVEMRETLAKLEAAEQRLLKEPTERDIQKQRKMWRAQYFANEEIRVVGTNDVILEDLKDLQKKHGNPPIIVQEEIRWRQEMQHDRKKAKRDKAKKKRQLNRQRRNKR